MSCMVLLSPWASTQAGWHGRCFSGRRDRAWERPGRPGGLKDNMLTIGDKLPEFFLQSVVSLEKGKEFQEVTHESFPGQWLVLFYWPMDFTFICPTEIAEFGRRNRDFH